MTLRSIPLMTALLATALLSACSTPSPEAVAQNDPWEATNRDFFDFDIKLDHAVLLPTAKFYRDVVPEPARDGVHNALTNLNSPVIFANDVLQGDGEKATSTLGRFVINSTVGVGGLIDVAAKAGIPGHDNDFGITLGKAGAAEGSYLVLPFAGPKPPRDLVGTGVDYAFDPINYIDWGGANLFQLVRGGMSVIDDRTNNIDKIESIERSSIDFYATTRNLYRQYRNSQINDGKANVDNLPNY
jgi:phospholipid-binding lipoprotein MlaA